MSKNNSNKKQMEDSFASLPSSCFNDNNNNNDDEEDEDIDSLCLTQHFRNQQQQQQTSSNYNNSKPKNSLLRRFQQEKAKSTTNNKRRSDISAITIDTALDSTANNNDHATTTESKDVVVVKDMTTVFSSSPPVEAFHTRRASLSKTAMPFVPCTDHHRQQQRRASLAGGDPSFTQNARQPQRLVEQPQQQTCAATTTTALLSLRNNMPQHNKGDGSVITTNQTTVGRKTTFDSPPRRQKQDPILPTHQEIAALTPVLEHTKGRAIPKSRTSPPRNQTSPSRRIRSLQRECHQSTAAATNPGSSPTTDSPSSSKQSCKSSHRTELSPSQQPFTSSQQEPSQGKRTTAPSSRLIPRSPAATSRKVTIPKNEHASLILDNDNVTLEKPIHQPSSSPRRLRSAESSSTSVPSSDDHGSRTSSLETTSIGQSACDSFAKPSSSLQRCNPESPETPTGFVRRRKSPVTSAKIRPAESSSTSVPSSDDHGSRTSSLKTTSIGQSACDSFTRQGSPRCCNPESPQTPTSLVRRQKSHATRQSSPRRGGAKKEDINQHASANLSSPSCSPRKHQEKIMHSATSCLPKVAISETAISSEASPNRPMLIESPLERRKIKSTSIKNHVDQTTTRMMTPSPQSSGRTPRQQNLQALVGNVQLPRLDSADDIKSNQHGVNKPSGTLETLHEAPKSPKKKSSTDVPNPRLTRKSRVASMSHTTMLINEGDPVHLKSPLRRKERATSIGHLSTINTTSILSIDSTTLQQKSDFASKSRSPPYTNRKADNKEEKPLKSPSRRRRRVASMQHVSATTLMVDGVHSPKRSTNSLTLRHQRSRSMQHVSNPVDFETIDAAAAAAVQLTDKRQEDAKKVTATTCKPVLILLKAECQTQEDRPEQRNCSGRRGASFDLMLSSTTGYDSAPETESIPMSDDDVKQTELPRYPRSRSIGFDADKVISDLTSFTNAAESKLERTRAKSSKSSGLFGLATGLFRKSEKKSVLTRDDGSSVMYAKPGGFLQERFRFSMPQD